MQPGKLTSPGFPYDYPTNLDMTGVIKVEEGLVIAVKFTAFNLEGFEDGDDIYDYYGFEPGSCSFDSLAITDGDGTSLMDKTCGEDLPPDLISNTDSVKVNLRTDRARTRSGYRLEWTAVSPGLSVL